MRQQGTRRATMAVSASGARSVEAMMRVWSPWMCSAGLHGEMPFFDRHLVDGARGQVRHVHRQLSDVRPAWASCSEPFQSIGRRSARPHQTQPPATQRRRCSAKLVADPDAPG